MNGVDYWRQRALILEETAHRQGAELAQAAEREFRAASRRLQDEIEGWYARVAQNNRVSLTEARRLLNARELEEFRWSVEEYIRRGQQNGLDGRWMRQLENASAQVHISRLEALQLQLQQEIELIYGGQLDDLDRVLRGVYSEGYYHTAFEIQRGFHLGWDLQSLDKRRLDAVLSRPWTTDGRTFRDRCWTNKEALVAQVQTSLTQGFIRGDGADRMTKEIAKAMGVSAGKAARLVMTETAYFSAQAQQDCYRELGVERFEVVETLDGHTCELCGGLDGKVLPMSAYEPGVTAPPFHPWCRGCTAPWFPNEFGERAARDHEGKTYYVPADMKYQEWAELQGVLPMEERNSGIGWEAPKRRYSATQVHGHGFGTGQEGRERARDAVVYDDGRIKVYVPSDLDRSAQVLTPDDIFDALDELPDGLLTHTQRIELVDYENPMDSYWAAVYNTSGFRSRATGGDGAITLYRRSERMERGELVRTLMHEAAHNLDRTVVDGGARLSDLLRYAEAVRLDGGFPSAYAEGAFHSIGSYAEDLADSVAYFLAAEDTFRKRFPNRSKILEEVLKWKSE